MHFCTITGSVIPFSHLFKKQKDDVIPASLNDVCQVSTIVPGPGRAQSGRAVSGIIPPHPCG